MGILKYLHSYKRVDSCELIENFLTLKPPNTRRAYAGAWKDFALLSLKEIKEITPRDAMRHLVNLRQRSLAPATLKARFWSLVAIFEHLKDMKVIDANPFLQVKKAIASRDHHQVRPTELVPFPKVKELLSLPDPRTKEGIRDAAILAILFGAGLRRNECRELTINAVRRDIDGGYTLALTRTKSGQDESQALAQFAFSALGRLLEQRRKEGAKSDDYLFVVYRADGTPLCHMADSTFYRIFKSYLKRLGLSGAPHAARATAATKLLADGESLLGVKEFLRHNSITSTLAYDKRLAGKRGSAAKKLKF